MLKAEVKDGVVVNIIVVDPDDIPSWCKAWPEAKGEDAVIGATYKNKTFTRPASVDVAVTE